MSNKTTTLRVHGDTYERLKKVKGEDESVQSFVEELIPNNMEKQMTRPEKETVGIRVNTEAARQANYLAGENMSVDAVINKLLENYE